MKILVSLLLCLAAVVSVQAQANKNIQALRQDRLTKFDAKMERIETARTEVWSNQKILVNLNARVPVFTVLGYFSALDPDTQKLQALRQRVQPIAAELALSSQSPIFVGTEFPSTLNDRLLTLRTSLFKAVSDIYGPDAAKEVESYADAAHTPALYVD